MNFENFLLSCLVCHVRAKTKQELTVCNSLALRIYECVENNQPM